MYCLAVSCRASNLWPWENAGSLPAVLPIPGTRLISQRTQQPAAKFIALPRLFFPYCAISGEMPTPPIFQIVEADSISGILSSHAPYHPHPASFRGMGQLLLGVAPLPPGSWSRVSALLGTSGCSLPSPDLHSLFWLRTNISLYQVPISNPTIKMCNPVRNTFLKPMFL